MNTQICTPQTILNTRLLSLAGIFIALENVASLVASYWYSAVFYFGYFSQMPNRH